MKEIP